MIVDSVAGVMKTGAELTDLFRTQGLRVTPQRQAIFRLLHENDAHPTVDALYDAARVEMPTISLKTVYQTVHDLEALGQVSLLDLGTGSVRVDPNVETEHHHLVCTECGRVRDVALAEVPSMPARYRKEFRSDAVEVIFRGRCQSCS
jgi:Fe2+ or Zn2+ uptake regulation protein